MKLHEIKEELQKQIPFQSMEDIYAKTKDSVMNGDSFCVFSL